MIYYTGIGSRETPFEILKIFNNIGKYLADKNYILRSGHAKGADQAFEHGCNEASGKKEIYLPWANFEGSNSKLVVENLKAYEIAQKFHPYWHNLKDGARKLQARNSHQVLGKNLNTLSNFIICWTKDGKDIGGTAQAIRIARHYEIPIFNAGEYKDISVFRNELFEFIKKIQGDIR